MVSSDASTSEAQANEAKIVMTDPSKISKLIECSSLGTAGARSLRGRTPPEVAQRILDRAAEHERTTANATDSVADLLPGLGDGDPAAWNEIVRRYGKLVSTAVRSFRLQDADALDAVQMTWLRLAENAQRVQFPERLGAWLVTTACRECLRILRQAETAPGLIDAGSETETVADSSPSPEQRVIDADTARTLQMLIDELSPRRRTLLRALFINNPVLYTEVAASAGMLPDGIGPTRARALGQLGRRLDECLLMATGHPLRRCLPSGGQDSVLG
jgi:RNA polymerase sigma factor (sigma-70 family)